MIISSIAVEENAANTHASTTNLIILWVGRWEIGGVDELVVTLQDTKQ